MIIVVAVVGGGGAFALLSTQIRFHSKLGELALPSKIRHSLYFQVVCQVSLSS